MTVAVCLDDNNGLQFNGRRQSRDRELLCDMQRETAGNIVITPFSEKLFAQAEIFAKVSNTPATEASVDDLVFYEEGELAPLLERATRLIVYRWNRVYPADVVWQGELPPHGFTLLREPTEFVGFSHETITKEVYVR